MFSHLKRRIGVLTAVAVLAALVPTLSAVSPVSAAPASTAVTVVDDAASYLACPTSAAIPSAGFTDTTDASVDCLKYFGIVNGTTATTYAPTDSVTRWQMALFVTRALDAANVTLGTGADQGFTDIAGKSAEIQTAINQIKQLGITTGVTATTYVPDNNVSRQQMALFIERMLDNLPAGPGGVSEADATGTSDASITYVNGNCGEGAGAKTCTGEYNYTDIDSGSVTVEASLAIKELFTLGIHEGVSVTTFNPLGDMTRASMATMINAAMNHSHLRPEGLHLQASNYSAATASNTPNLSVSYRDASFDPIASAPVDVFYWTNSTTEGNAAFLSTGACDNSLRTALAITGCYIDVSEPKTDENGNMEPTANGTAPVSIIYNGTDTYHAWTAAAATTYDDDLHGETAAPNTHSSIDVVATPAAASLRCSMDTPARASTATEVHTMKYGAVTTVTCQVVNGLSGTTAGAVADATQYVKLERTQTFTTDNTGGQSGEILAASATLSLTGADGSVAFTIDGPADRNTAVGDVITDAITITVVGGLGLEYAYNTTVSTSGYMADDGNDLQFSLAYKDAVVASTTMTSTQTATHSVASTSGVTRSVTGNVWDQYGDAVSGETVTFTSASALVNNLGMICATATPAAAVCTSNLAHGLAVGDFLTLSALGATATGDTGAAASVTLAAGARLKVSAVGTTTTLTLTDDSGNDVILSADSTAAEPMLLVRESFAPANNSRTTSTTGAASFSWVDTEGTSGADVVTAVATGGAAPSTSKTFYRLGTTPTNWENTGDMSGTLEVAEIVSRIEEFDGTNDFMIVSIQDTATGTLELGHETTQYYRLNFDSNDQFANTATNANQTGVSATQSAWETSSTKLAAASALSAAVADDLSMWNYAALSTGVSRFYTN